MRGQIFDDWLSKSAWTIMMKLSGFRRLTQHQYMPEGNTSFEFSNNQLNHFWNSHNLYDFCWCVAKILTTGYQKVHELSWWNNQGSEGSHSISIFWKATNHTNSAMTSCITSEIAIMSMIPVDAWQKFWRLVIKKCINYHDETVRVQKTHTALVYAGRQQIIRVQQWPVKSLLG